MNRRSQSSASARRSRSRTIRSRWRYSSGVSERVAPREYPWSQDDSWAPPEGPAQPARPNTPSAHADNTPRNETLMPHPFPFRDHRGQAGRSRPRRYALPIMVAPTRHLSTRTRFAAGDWVRDIIGGCDCRPKAVYAGYRLGLQAEGLFWDSRGQAQRRPRMVPPPRSDPERVIYAVMCMQRCVQATPAGSNGTGVGRTVGGAPPRRDLPTATFGQPFRLHPRTAPEPPEVSHTLAPGTSP